MPYEEIVKYMQKCDKKKIIELIAIKFAWLVILCFGKLGRVTVRNRHYHTNLVKNHQRFLIVAWHGKMMLPIYIHRNQNILAMISQHGDGEIIARTVERLGYQAVRGSSTRGGSLAFRQMLKQLRQGHVSTILPDGPRGPRQQFKLGAILLAQRARAYLLPVTFAAKKPIVMKSWDRFTLWWPFSRLVVLYGAPLLVPDQVASDQLESFRQIIEQRMLDLDAEADAVFRS